MRGLILLINAVMWVVQTLLSVRFLLKFFGADARAPFVAWLYDTTNSLIAPFAGAFPASTVNGHFVIEFTTLFALIVYSLIAYFLGELIAFTADASLRRRRLVDGE